MKQISIQEVQDLQLNLMKALHHFFKENQIPYYLIAGSALGAVRHNGFIPWDDDIDIGMMREDYQKFLSISKDFDNKYEIINFENAKNCDFGLTRIYIPNTYIDNKSIEKTKLDKRLYFDVFPLDNVPNDSIELKKYEKKIIKIKRKLQLVDVRNYNNSKSVLFVKRMVSFFLQPFRKKILFSFDRLMKKYQHQTTKRVCSLCSQYSFKKQVMPREVYGTPVLHKFEDSEFFIPEKINEYLTILYGNDYMELPPIEKRRKGHDIYLIEGD